MKLHECITKGIEKRKFRAQGVYFAGTDKSDVLGAAYQGLTGLDDVHNHMVEDTLDREFSILKVKVSNPETGKVETLKDCLRHLNDVHKWKRVNIARFVKSVEQRREVQEAIADQVAETPVH